MFPRRRAVERRAPGRRAKEFDHVKSTLHQRDVVFFQGDLFNLIGKDGLPGVVEQRGADEVHEDAVVGEDEETFRPAIQGAFLEGLEQVPEGRVGEIADSLDGGALGGGGCEVLGIVGGRCSRHRRDRQGATGTAHRQQEGQNTKQVTSPGVWKQLRGNAARHSPAYAC